MSAIFLFYFVNACKRGNNIHYRLPMHINLVREGVTFTPYSVVRRKKSENCMQTNRHQTSSVRACRVLLEHTRSPCPLNCFIKTARQTIKMRPVQPQRHAACWAINYHCTVFCLRECDQRRGRVLRGVPSRLQISHVNWFHYGITAARARRLSEARWRISWRLLLSFGKLSYPLRLRANAVGEGWALLISFH